ncbi:pca operon transcription factor PcaQ [Alkalilimnicola sp. S0819]|uniref:pca operon transcription factor PcaQ n=1 Tax=Alkalilimnicola sp. S0819 TaxID=2613922 RepID=UPI0012622996|nr:pca operon transcription factor PcaQ [Alkalilimnicola sp. S0819]KAB7619512.1 pca operon transcription factor PcaQ [Alkalilimnicola sp. S0819]MPQ17660.1 pca operon transcription factor PcaQ [Alkalilimnicola sp. S0819]
MSPMDIARINDRVKQRHLRCFVEVVRRGTLAEAAEVLAISPSAASKTLSELEELIGERLMERGRRGATLTPAGEIFYRYASASLTAVQEGVALIAQARRDARHSVLVGALPNVANRVLPGAVEAFKRHHPETTVVIYTGTNKQLLTQLRVGELDFVVGRLSSPQDMMGLRFEELFYENLAIVARPDHPLVRGGRPLQTGVLARYRVILPLSGTIIRHDCERWLISRGLTELHDIVESVSAEFGRASVLRSDTLWVTPRGMIALDLDQGWLAELPLDTSNTSSPVGITTRGEAGLGPLARQFLGCVRQGGLRLSRE